MKKSRSENIIVLVFSLFVIVLGVLQLKGVIDFNDDTGLLKYKPKLAGAIILCLGVFKIVAASSKFASMFLKIPPIKIYANGA